MVTPVQTVTSSSLSFSITGVTAGNTLILTVVSITFTSSNSFTISDGSGNVYNLVDQQNPAGGTLATGAAYVLNATAGTINITVAVGGPSSSVAIICREYLANDCKSFDLHAVATGTGATPTSGTTSIISQPSETVIGWCYTAAVGSAPTAGAGFGNIATKEASTVDYVALEDKDVSSSGTQQATFNAASSALYACGVMTFKKGNLLPVQTVTGVTTSTQVINGVVTGNTLCGVVGVTGSISGISDSAGNTYVLVDSNSSTPNALTGFYALNVTGGNLTLTLAGSISSGAIVINELHQSDAVSFDLHAYASGTTGAPGTATSGTTGTTTQASETLMGWVFFGNAGAVTAPTLGSGYSSLGSQVYNTSHSCVATEFKSVVSTGTYNATFGILSGATGWNCGVMTFKTGASAATHFLSLLGVG